MKTYRVHRKYKRRHYGTRDFSLLPLFFLILPTALIVMALISDAF